MNTPSKPVNTADQYERVQIGMARMCLLVGMGSLTLTASDVWPDIVGPYARVIVLVLMALALLFGLVPLLRSPREVQDRVRTFGFMPKSLDELIDLFSVKAVSISLLVVLITQIFAFPVIEKVWPDLMAERDFFELCTGIILATYGLSIIIMSGRESGEDDA